MLNGVRATQTSRLCSKLVNFGLELRRLHVAGQIHIQLTSQRHPHLDVVHRGAAPLFGFSGGTGCLLEVPSLILGLLCAGTL